MIPLYLIIIYFGTVGGNVGPLPYDMDECLERAADMRQSFLAALKDPVKLKKLQQQRPDVNKESMYFVCRRTNKRPVNGSPWVDLPNID